MNVFLSYANENKMQISAVVVWLENEGFQVNWDQAVVPGEPWEDKLIAAINDCDVVCICLTPDSIRSDWVKREYMMALHNPRFSS